MSAGAKIALAVSVAYAGSMVVFVHYSQHSERKVCTCVILLLFLLYVH